MVTHVKNTAWSLGLYTLFAAGKTLLNTPWHKNAPTVFPEQGEATAPKMERKISMIKTGAQVGGGALLLGATAALEGAYGGTGLSTIASAAQSAAGYIFENFALTTKLLAAFALGYYVKRCITNPAIAIHLNIHNDVKGGKGAAPIIHYVPQAPLTSKQVAIRKLFQKLVFKKLEIERSKAEARQAREELHYKRLLKQLES